MSLADRYAQLRGTDRVRERTLFVSPQVPSELELQARWFAGDFGKHFTSTAGDERRRPIRHMESRSRTGFS